MTLESMGMISAIIMMLSFPICIYAIYTKLEKTEEHLKFSSFIVTFKYRFGFGLFGGRLKRSFRYRHCYPHAKGFSMALLGAR